MRADFCGDRKMMCWRCAMRSNIQNRDGIARTLDWLDQLREDGHGNSVMTDKEDGHSKFAFDSGGDPASGASRAAEATAQPTEPAAAQTTADATMGAMAPPASSASGGAGICASPEIAERAPIGDELRIPMAWCEMDSCILHYEHPAALGEADIRSRAIAAGWRIDALGRLACPQCQQGPSFWAAQRVTPWDRDKAVAMASRMAAAAREAGIAGPEGGQAAWIPAAEQPLVPLPGPGWNREYLDYYGRDCSGRAH
jgi:hypothetical protein